MAACAGGDVRDRDRLRTLPRPRTWSVPLRAEPSELHPWFDHKILGLEPRNKGRWLWRKRVDAVVDILKARFRRFEHSLPNFTHGRFVLVCKYSREERTDNLDIKLCVNKTRVSAIIAFRSLVQSVWKSQLTDERNATSPPPLIKKVSATAVHPASGLLHQAFFGSGAFFQYALLMMAILTLGY